jgi:glycosyltransferase involved in cell wall biosynthesis
VKHVLIIGFLKPYREGSGRVIGLAKHLPEFGWQPIVVTAPLHQKPDLEFDVIETPYSSRVIDFWKSLLGFNHNEGVRKQVRRKFNITSKEHFIDYLLTYCGAVINYPDGYRKWRSSAFKACDELLQREKVDALISVWPITSHLVAKDLKAKYKIPWIADFPDLWSQNYNYQYGPLRWIIDKRLELKTLLSADVLTTVTGPWAEKLKILHGRKSVYVITHGFPQEDIEEEESELTSKFVITYTGTIYIGKQDPSKLFFALKDLVSDGTMDRGDVEVRFYGDNERWLANEIDKYGLSNIAKLYGKVPRRVACEKQRESQLLLLLNWEDPREKRCCPCPLKIFEYLAAKRPIIATGGFGGDVVKDLIEETEAGFYASTTQEIKHILKQLYLEYKLKGKIGCSGDITKINRYSYREKAREFAEILISFKK